MTHHFYFNVNGSITSRGGRTSLSFVTVNSARSSNEFLVGSTWGSHGAGDVDSGS